MKHAEQYLRELVTHLASAEMKDGFGLLGSFRQAKNVGVEAHVRVFDAQRRLLAQSEWKDRHSQTDVSRGSELPLLHHIADEIQLCNPPRYTVQCPYKNVLFIKKSLSSHPLFELLASICLSSEASLKESDLWSLVREAEWAERLLDEDADAAATDEGISQ